MLTLDHDLHLHTSLSACYRDKSITVEQVVRNAERLGFRLIGIANHLWDNPEAEPSGWYAPQNLEHALSIRQDLEEIETDLTILVGCETEFAGPGRLGISPEAAAELDFVLVPCTHLHMIGFVDQPDAETPESLARHMCEMFRSAVATGVATAVAHAFLPCGDWSRMTVDSLGYISDTEFADLFGFASEKKVALELHSGFFRSAEAGEGGRDEAFARMVSLAKGSGMKFTLGSDAHDLEGMAVVASMREPLERIGITDDDFAAISLRGSGTTNRHE